MSGKLPTYNKLYQYADGVQPLVYSTQRLKEAFGSLTARFNMNWCSVVVNATLDRLMIRGFDPVDKDTNDQLDALWSQFHLGLDAYDVHRDALITGEGYIIAWKEGEQIDVYRNDPRLVHLFYLAERPKEKEFAAKWWVEDEKVTRLVLYYPDRLEYYRAKTKTPTSASAFEKDPSFETAENPFAVVPVFHFTCPGELSDIMTLQDAVNKLTADMMVAAEYGAFRQRWVITNAETNGLKNGPNNIWEIPAGDGVGQQSQVGEFSATELKNYTESIDNIADKIAIISRTPKHYLSQVGGNISGDALNAMEAPLLKKVAQRQERFSLAWQELAAYLLRLEGTQVEESSLIPVWEPAQSDQPITDAQSTQYQVQAGIPLETVLRRKGWGKGEILQMREDAAEVRRTEESLSKVLLERLRAESDAQNLGGEAGE